MTCARLRAATFGGVPAGKRSLADVACLSGSPEGVLTGVTCLEASVDVVGLVVRAIRVDVCDGCPVKVDGIKQLPPASRILLEANEQRASRLFSIIGKREALAGLWVVQRHV